MQRICGNNGEAGKKKKKKMIIIEMQDKLRRKEGRRGSRKEGFGYYLFV